MLIVSGEITCINSLNWYIADSATYEAGYTKNFYGAFTFGDNLVSWFNTWSQLSNNYTVSINFLGSILIIIFKYIVFKYKKIYRLSTFFLSVYIIFIYSLWITNAPAIRLGMGIFLLNIGLLGLGSSSFRFEFTNKLVQNKTHVLLLIFVYLQFRKI